MLPFLQPKKGGFLLQKMGGRKAWVQYPDLLSEKKKRSYSPHSVSWLETQLNNIKLVEPVFHLQHYLVNHSVYEANRERWTKKHPLITAVHIISHLCLHINIFSYYSIPCTFNILCWKRFSPVFSGPLFKRWVLLFSLYWSFAFMSHAHWLQAASCAASQKAA